MNDSDPRNAVAPLDGRQAPVIPNRVTRIRRVWREIVEEQVVFTTAAGTAEYGGQEWRDGLSEDRWVTVDTVELREPEVVAGPESVQMPPVAKRA